MNKQLLSLLLAVLFVLTCSSLAMADEEEKDVEPNIYKKKEINIINHFRDNIIEKRELPEEQHGLTFEKSEQTKSEQIVNELFQSSTVETNTITAKADQLELFSEASPVVKEDPEEEANQNDSNLLLIIMIALVAVLVAMLLLIIPKLQHTQE